MTPDCTVNGGVLRARPQRLMASDTPLADHIDGLMRRRWPDLSHLQFKPNQVDRRTGELHPTRQLDHRTRCDVLRWIRGRLKDAGFGGRTSSGNIDRDRCRSPDVGPSVRGFSFAPANVSAVEVPALRFSLKFVATLPVGVTPVLATSSPAVPSNAGFRLRIQRGLFVASYRSAGLHDQRIGGCMVKTSVSAS